MALNVQIKANMLESKSDETIHLMPCKIDFDGPAKVGEYFSTYVDKKILINGDDVLEASFRGYPLHGKEVNVPKGYHGIIITEMKKPLSEVEQKSASATKKFDSFTYWNWDIQPSQKDSYQRMMDWISLSEVVHKD